MAKLSFKMTDVTGDARVLARSAMGYDWNYYADDETIIFGSDSDATIAWDGDSLEVTSADTNFQRLSLNRELLLQELLVLPVLSSLTVHSYVKLLPMVL